MNATGDCQGATIQDVIRCLIPLVVLLVVACTAPEAATRRMAPPNTVDDVIYAPPPAAFEPPAPWVKSLPPLTLEADVRADGSVADAKVVGWDLTHTIGGIAADTLRSWRFERGPPRRRFVTFIFEGDPIDGPTHISAQLRPHLTFHVVSHYDSVARWPRSGGRIPERTCQVHRERMTIEIVPIEYGGIPPPPPSPLKQAYMLASSAFPNGYDRAGGGCVPGPHTRAEIYVCASCRKARAAWIAAHGGSEPME